MEIGVRFIGGCRIGWAHASWPLASLRVRNNTISLYSPFMGRYDFAPNEIISFEKISWGGIRIAHNKSNYPEKILFYDSPGRIFDAIRNLQFIPTGIPGTALKGRGFPLRWDIIFLAIILWNVLIGIDMYYFHSDKLGIFSIVALLSVFVISLIVRSSSFVQNIFLKPGHNYEEVKHIFNLLTIISGTVCFLLALTLLMPHVLRL